jgi:homoserine kinase
MSQVEDRIIVRVPASTANIGSGFDSIGIAYQLYLTVEVELSHKTEFIWKGNELSGTHIPDKDNLILQAIERVYSLVEEERPHFSIEVDSEIPLTRGLGSSASAYVAGLVIANEFLGCRFNDDELLWLATEEEGHPDNVGASLLGGVCIASVDWESKKVHYHKQTFPAQWTWLAAIPSYTLSTALARDLLPKEYPTSDTIFNLSRYGVLVASLLTGNKEGMVFGLKDALHHPYRQQLIPGFQRLVDEREELDVIGFVISGAGPTVLALVDTAREPSSVLNYMEKVMKVDQHHIRTLTLAVDQEGYTVQRVLSKKMVGKLS